MWTVQLVLNISEHVTAISVSASGDNCCTELPVAHSNNYSQNKPCAKGGGLQMTPEIKF